MISIEELQARARHERERRDDILRTIKKDVSAHDDLLRQFAARRHADAVKETRNLVSPQQLS